MLCFVKIDSDSVEVCLLHLSREGNSIRDDPTLQAKNSINTTKKAKQQLHHPDKSSTPP